MADKRIGQLNTAPGTVDDSNTLFAVEQNGTAYKLDGAALVDALAAILDGHGGISSIAKTETSGLVDTYQITFADGSTSSFNVTNGKQISSITQYWAVSSSNSTVPTTWYTTRQTMTAANKYLWSYFIFTYNNGTASSTAKSVIGVYGDTGPQTYVWFKWADEYPQSDSDMQDSVGAYIGVYSGLSSTAPTSYTDYTWYEYKGEKGDPGDTIESIERTGSSGLTDTYTIYVSGHVALDTFTVNNGKSIVSVEQTGGNHAAGTYDVYTITYNDGDTSTFRIYNGANGTGSVSTVDGIAATNQNVTLLLTGNGPPTATTAGSLYQRYFDLSNQILYICIGVDTSTNPYNYSWAGAGVPVDAALSTTSENPVQNKAITAKVGTVNLNTTAQNLSGAINELDSAVDDANDALALKAPIASPALTGTPKAPTPGKSTNSTQIATTAFVHSVADDYVLKSGGTMTGRLSMTSTGLTDGTRPSSVSTGSDVEFLDSAGYAIGYAGTYWLADGRQGTQYGSRRKIGTDNIYNVLRFYIDESGNRTVAFTESAPWRTALSVYSKAEVDSLAYFESGDTYATGSAAHSSASSGAINIVGVVTMPNAYPGGQVTCTMTLPKSLAHVTGVNVTRLAGRIFGPNGYLVSNANTDMTSGGYSVAAGIRGEYEVYIQVRADSTVPFTNTNAGNIAMVNASITLEFT